MSDYRGSGSDVAMQRLEQEHADILASLKGAQSSAAAAHRNADRLSAALVTLRARLAAAERVIEAARKLMPKLTEIETCDECGLKVAVWEVERPRCGGDWDSYCDDCCTDKYRKHHPGIAAEDVAAALAEFDAVKEEKP